MIYKSEKKDNNFINHALISFLKYVQYRLTIYQHS